MTIPNFVTPWPPRSNVPDPLPLRISSRRCSSFWNEAANRSAWRFGCDGDSVNPAEVSSCEPPPTSAPAACAVVEKYREKE